MKIFLLFSLFVTVYTYCVDEADGLIWINLDGEAGPIYLCLDGEFLPLKYEDTMITNINNLIAIDLNVSSYLNGTSHFIICDYKDKSLLEFDVFSCNCVVPQQTDLRDCGCNKTSGYSLIAFCKFYWSQLDFKPFTKIKPTTATIKTSISTTTEIKTSTFTTTEIKPTTTTEIKTSTSTTTEIKPTTTTEIKTSTFTTTEIKPTTTTEIKTSTATITEIKTSTVTTTEIKPTTIAVNIISTTNAMNQSEIITPTVAPNKQCQQTSRFLNVYLPMEFTWLVIHLVLFFAAIYIITKKLNQIKMKIKLSEAFSTELITQ